MRTHDELNRALRMSQPNGPVEVTQEELSSLLFKAHAPLILDRPDHPLPSDFPNVAGALNVQVGGGHYKKMRIQPIEYCEANELGACESAIVKYISRWESKGGLQDLEKIKHYVDLLIETREKYPRDTDQSAPNQVKPEGL